MKHPINKIFNYIDLNSKEGSQKVAQFVLQCREILGEPVLRVYDNFGVLLCYYGIYEEKPKPLWIKLSEEQAGIFKELPQDWIILSAYIKDPRLQEYVNKVLEKGYYFIGKRIKTSVKRIYEVIKNKEEVT